VNISDPIVGIDVGTTKICTVVAGFETDEKPTVLGVGLVQSRGLRKGRVTNLDRTISSIRESKIQAEQAAGVTLDSAYVSVTGGHIRCDISNATTAITDPNKGITLEDTEHVIELAQRVDIPKGRRLIDVHVRDYIVDGQVGISDPVGMSGMRLEANVLLISTAIPEIEDIYRAVNQAGIDVENIILAPIASAEGTLAADEKETGTAIIDIGGGTTDLAVYRDGGLVHSKIFSIGGDHFDSDLSYGIGISPRQAEHLKIKLGGVSSDYMSSDDIIEISRDGGERRETLPMKIVAEIIYPRMEEILTVVYEDLKSTGLAGELPGGLVLTGGTSQMPGITETASEIFNMQTRIGYPRDINGLQEEMINPIYSTAIGLVKLGAEDVVEKWRQQNALRVNDSIAVAMNWTRSQVRKFFR